MAKQRIINTKFWDDNYIINLDPIEKLLFLYFLTNPLTNICGIYEISPRRIAFDTEIDSEMVNRILERFAQDDRIYYFDGWVCIKNFIKNQNIGNSRSKVVKGIELGLESIPQGIWQKIENTEGLSGGIKDHLSSLNYSNSNSNSNINTSTSKNINEIFHFWNSLKIIQHRSITTSIKSSITARLKNYSEDEIKQAMNNYRIIVEDPNCFFKYRWTLTDFLSRGEGKNIDRFLDLKQAKANFAKDKQETSDGYVI